METPTSQTSRSVEAARRWNRDFAKRVRRWKRVRLAWAIGLSAAGIATFLSKSASLWSPPCLIAAFIAFLLYVDSRDQLREVEARNWTSITPRISRISGRKPSGGARTESSP